VAETLADIPGRQRPQDIPSTASPFGSPRGFRGVGVEGGVGCGWLGSNPLKAPCWVLKEQAPRSSCLAGPLWVVLVGVWGGFFGQATPDHSNCLQGPVDCFPGCCGCVVVVGLFVV
jgi:hypothetical protein